MAPPLACGLTIKLSASAPVTEVVAEPGMQPGTNMFTEASAHERADLAPQVLDEELGILVTRVTATRRVGLLVPPSNSDPREIRRLNDNCAAPSASGVSRSSSV